MKVTGWMTIDMGKEYNAFQMETSMKDSGLKIKEVKIELLHF